MSESQAKFTNDDLKKLQALNLEEKIQISKARIIEWYEAYNGQVYVSFSGGKDSTVLLDLVRKIYPDVPAVFVDTGLEYPELREFVKTVSNVTWLKPKMNFRKVIETYGYPIISKEVSRDVGRVQKNGSRNKRTGELSWAYKSLCGLHEMPMANKGKWKPLIDAPFKISNQCCDIMKKNSVHLYEKGTKRKPYIGTMTCESKQRRAQWLASGCNSFDAHNPSSKPMSFWTEQDVLAYIKKFDLSYASVYGEVIADDKGILSTTGCHRTGCIFCGYGVHLEKEPNRFQHLKQTHPKLWDYCMRPWG